MVSFSNLQLCIKYKNNFIAECLKENTTRPYTTLLFFSFGLLSLSIFFFYFYFFGIVLDATTYDFCLFHWTNLSLWNVLFFSFAFCLFRVFSSTSISSRLSGLQPHMVFCLFYFGKNCPLGNCLFVPVHLLYYYYFLAIFILLFSLTSFGFFYFYYFNSHINI